MSVTVLGSGDKTVEQQTFCLSIFCRWAEFFLGGQLFPPSWSPKYPPPLHWTPPPNLTVWTPKWCMATVNLGGGGCAADFQSDGCPCQALRLFFKVFICVNWHALYPHPKKHAQFHSDPLLQFSLSEACAGHWEACLLLRALVQVEVHKFHKFHKFQWNFQREI